MTYIHLTGHPLTSNVYYPITLLYVTSQLNLFLERTSGLYKQFLHPRSDNILKCIDKIHQEVINYIIGQRSVTSYIRNYSI